VSQRSGRLALWLLTLLVSVTLYLQGRPISHTRVKVAFLPGGTAEQGGATFRIEGACVKAGVYHFNNTIQLGTVINMTVPFCQDISRNKDALEKILYTGDIVLMPCCNGKHAEITRDAMHVVDKMILGLPLDPNRLTSNEWEMLPQIGPALARRIVIDRQKNGDFLSVRDLERVIGIGPATVKQLDGYFEKK
jgi:competence protein ComEA